MDGPTNLSEMSPGEMAVAYAEAVRFETQMTKEINLLSQRIGPLAAEREEKRHAITRSEETRKALRSGFSEATGRDIRKHLRTPAQEALEVAIGALLAAVSAPSLLMPDDPVVVARLLAVRAAGIAKQKEQSEMQTGQVPQLRSR